MFHNQNMFLLKIRYYKSKRIFGYFPFISGIEIIWIRKKKNTNDKETILKGKKETKMEIDEYWRQFVGINKKTSQIAGGLYCLSEFFGLAFVLANTAFLFR